MPTDQELWEIQSRVTEVLLTSGAEPQEWQLRDAAQLLSGTLREIVDDQPFWAAVGSAANDESVQLAAVLTVDWPRVFEACGYSADDGRKQAADALGTVSDVLTSESVEWEQLRSRMSVLADRLAEDAKDGATHDRRWWHRLRDRIGFGLGAVRRVSVKKLFIELGKGAAQNVVAALVTGAVGGPGFMAAQFFGVLAGRIAIALADELVRGWTEESDFRESARLRAMVQESPLFHVSRLARVALVKAADLPEFEGILDRLRRWVARVGLDLANAWSHVVAHLGRPGAEVLTGMFGALQTIRAALAPYLTAKKDQFAELAAATDATIRRALVDLDVRSMALTTMLVTSGTLEKG